MSKAVHQRSSEAKRGGNTKPSSFKLATNNSLSSNITESAASRAFGNQFVQKKISQGKSFKTKLTLGNPNDFYEKEADNVAEKIINPPVTATKTQLSNKPSITKVNNNYLQRKENEEEQLVQLKSTDAANAKGGSQFQADIRHLQGNGQGLNPSDNHYFNRRFGRNLDHVRLHNNDRAHHLSKQINARAFTIGNNIVFGSGQYQPHKLSGRRLIAHELTHVFQQENANLIQREPLGEDKKQQLRVTASKYAIDDLNDIIDKIENLSEAERAVFDKKLKQIQTTGKKVEADLETSSIENKVVYIKFVKNWNHAFEYEPLVFSHTNGSRVWMFKGKELSPTEFITLFSFEAKKKESIDLELVRSFSQRLANPRRFALEGFTTHNLTEILKAENIPSVDFYSGIDESGGSVFVSSTANQIDNEITDETGEALSEEKKQELEDMDEATLKLIMELMKQNDSDLETAIRTLKNLSRLELEILRANAMLNEGKKGTSERIKLNPADIKDITTGSGMGGLNDSLKSIKNLEQQLLDQLKNTNGAKTPPNSKFSLLAEVLKSFESEVIMVKGLLKGAARRNPELATFELELGTAFNELLKEIQKEMLISGIFDVAISFVPYVGLINLMRKIQKIIDLIALIRKVLAIKDEIADVGNKLENTRTQFKHVQEMAKKLDEFNDEEIEEKIFEIIEDNKLNEILYFPGLDGLSEEDAQDKILKIIHDVPKGVDLYSQMHSQYKSMPKKPTDKELSLLGIKSFVTGASLSPVVTYLALKILENMSNAKSMVGGKSFFDRITKRKGRKNKNNKKRRKNKKDKSDKTLKKMDTRNVEYIKAEVETVLESNYKPRILAALEDTNNSLGQHAWTESYFKNFVDDEAKKINRDRSKISIKAWKKPKKKVKGATKTATKAPMLSISASFNTKVTPWRVTIKTRKVKASVSMQASAAKFKKMNYASFTGSGIAFDTRVIAGEDKTNKKKKINTWLTNKEQGYQWTNGVDASGDEIKDKDKAYLRLRDGQHTPGFLRVDNGYIVQNIDPKAYKNFLGKKLTGNQTAMNKKLPPGYHVKNKNLGGINVAGKKGAGTTQILNIDSGLLAEGNAKRTPSVVKPKGSIVPTYDPLTAPQINTMIDNMFEKDVTTGVVKVPETVGSEFKSQGKTTHKKWRDYIDKKPDLKQRPKTIVANLGYTTNVSRKSLSSFHLPELKNTDDKGHLVAARFSGKPNANHLDTLNNLVPMNSTTNQKGDWQELERKMAQVYIGSKKVVGDHVHLEMTLNYDLNYKKYIRRPDTIDTTWRHMRGTQEIGTKKEKKITTG